MPETLERLAFSLKHTAVLADCSVNHLRNMIRSGELRAVRLGNRWRIPKAELLRLCGASRQTRLKREKIRQQ
jgi:excisionase family DNA binding protein